MKKFISLVLVMIMVCSLCACGGPVGVNGGTDTAKQEEGAPPVKISYMSEFYDNHGSQWLGVEGTSFSIEPNKVKEYGYNSSGSWIYSWTTSSVMSITVDKKHIESCGSTVLFYDTRLKKVDYEFPKDVTLSQGDSVTIHTPYDGYNYFEDQWGLGMWFWTEKQANKTPASRLVVIQSQEGDPICMFAGDKVEWSVSRELPKTTEVMIDGKVVYIHRANFSIIDTAVFE